MQVALPCLLYAPTTSRLILKGGTNAEFAPPIDYMVDVSYDNKSTVWHGEKRELLEHLIYT